MDMENFKHKIEEEVKFHEVDLLGVCNNAVYFNYFEDARIGYIKHVKEDYKLEKLLEGSSFFIMAHNECDYIEPAKFEDKLNVYTKIDFLKKSSFGLSHIVENVKTKRIIAKGGGVLVHIDFNTKKSVPLPEEFINAVKDYEDEVSILKE